jgi:hypothetical protein
MSMTITLNDDLVGQLRRQAQTRRVSVEQWALTILGHAAENPEEMRSWANLNQRRFDLIQKRYPTGGVRNVIPGKGNYLRFGVAERTP